MNNLRLSLAQRARINKLLKDAYGDQSPARANAVVLEVSKGACKSVGELSPHLADVVMRELEKRIKASQAA